MGGIRDFQQTRNRTVLGAAMFLPQFEALLRFWTPPWLLVHSKLVILMRLNFLNPRTIQESPATRCGWYPLCFIPMPEKERFHLRGSMRTLIDGATPLSEHGEAVPQSSRNEKGCQNGVQSGTPLAHWYALHTYPRHEKRVYGDLGLHSIECFLPLYETVHRWKNGCKVRVELPLFPGYLFVKIDPRQRVKVLGLPGAVSIVGSISGPWPLPDAVIVSLRERLQARKFAPHPYLAIGQKVRIKSGPLADLTGYLVRQSGGLRVVISVDLIRQSAAVEVDAGDVEPIGPAPMGIDA